MQLKNNKTRAYIKKHYPILDNNFFDMMIKDVKDVGTGFYKKTPDQQMKLIENHIDEWKKLWAKIHQRKIMKGVMEQYGWDIFKFEDQVFVGTKEEFNQKYNINE